MGPDGPYHLGGWSLGGVVALEMARQLADAGAPVGTVVLFDPGLWVGPRPPDDLSVLSAFVHDLAGAAGAAPPAVDPGPLRGTEAEVLEASMLDLLDRAGLVPGGLLAPRCACGCGPSSPTYGRSRAIGRVRTTDRWC